MSNYKAPDSLKKLATWHICCGIILGIYGIVTIFGMADAENSSGTDALLFVLCVVCASVLIGTGTGLNKLHPVARSIAFAIPFFQIPLFLAFGFPLGYLMAMASGRTSDVYASTSGSSFVLAFLLVLILWFGAATLQWRPLRSDAAKKAFEEDSES